MSWSLAIKALFDALTAYLQLKAHTFYYDLVQKTRDKQQIYAERIEKLRSTGKPDDADAADLLFKYLQSEKQFIINLPALNSQANQGK